MTKKGQIVEIPASSPIYSRELPGFHSKKDELIWKSRENEYSLFDGFLVGEHQGVENFKIGQRKGINVGGKKEPLYVIWIDVKENRLFVGAGDSHPGLSTATIRLGENLKLNDISFSKEELEKGIDVEISTSINEDDLSAKLYGFDESFFLQFENKVSVTVEDNPFDIIYQNRIIKSY
ncbi:tRNA-specific 2-thiouridylase [Epilithonimonas hungarica]|uniref:tRNA methyl transferase PRC-barrel domain-containing protein n=1 Tax=Epilithonimonas hungarica TaxID=454006 RepID=UPI002780BBA5|nr:tRNA methyl transferase PRC-barrel domain-containing protein [Epilithonimonas hungarica]MDP9955952.1 tRNA-specific 2-thiouridylase [Epilithonimonas hungarica]